MRRSRENPAGRPALLLVRRNGEAPASLAAAVGQHLGPAGRLHPGPKAVLTQAARVVGLVGPLHGKAPRCRRALSGGRNKPRSCETVKVRTTGSFSLSGGPP